MCKVYGREIGLISAYLNDHLGPDDASLVGYIVGHLGLRQPDVTVKTVSSVLSIFIDDAERRQTLAVEITRIWHSSILSDYSRSAAWEYLLESGLDRDDANRWLDAHCHGA